MRAANRTQEPRRIIPEREAWEEYERRRGSLLDERDAGRLEPDACALLIMQLAEGMGL